MSNLIKKLLLAFILFSFLGFISIFSLLWTYSNKLPDYKFLKNYKPPVSSKVYSGDGVLITDFSAEKRIFVPYNAITKKIIYSFLSFEDKNFFIENRKKPLLLICLMWLPKEDNRIKISKNEKYDFAGPLISYSIIFNKTNKKCELV